MDHKNQIPSIPGPPQTTAFIKHIAATCNSLSALKFDSDLSTELKAYLQLHHNDQTAISILDLYPEASLSESRASRTWLWPPGSIQTAPKISKIKDLVRAEGARRPNAITFIAPLISKTDDKPIYNN